MTTKRMSKEDRLAVYPKTPTLDRMNRIKDESHKIGKFIEWLKEQGIEFCVFETGRRSGNPRDDEYVPATISTKEEKAAGVFMGEKIGKPCTTENLLAVYFGINLEEVERERRAVLDWLQ